MNKKVLFLCSLCCSVLIGCNGVGSGEDRIARVDNETVYAEDLDLAIKVSSAGRSDLENISNDLLSRAAYVSKALQDFPELKTRWEEYSKSMEDRLLTLVYQRFYSMECLTYSEADLRNYFNTHKSEFAKDSGEVEFLDVRDKVAEHLLLTREAEKFKELGTDTAAFIAQYKRDLVTKTIKEVKEKYPVTIEKIVPQNQEAFYEAHKEEFKTAHAFEVYHVQMEDSAALAKVFKKPVKDLEQFKALATKYSENKETAANGGYVGKVKEGFSLPYGIGFINGLAEALSGKPEGTVSPILASPRSPGRHVFYLVKEFPPEVKPFDRVKGEVESRMLTQGYLELDPGYVLISKNGEPFITEKDILTIFEEEPGLPRTNMMRDRIVGSLAECASFADEARALKLDHSWEYRAYVRQTRDNYILAHYEELVTEKESLPEDSLKSYFEKNGNPARPSLTFEESKQDLNDYIKFPDNVVKHEYYFNHMLYKNKTIEDLRKQVYSNNIRAMRKARKEAREAEIWANADVHVYKKDLPVKPGEHVNHEVLFKAADSLYKARLYDLAIDKLRQVRLLYADNDSLYAQATLLTAQVNAEAERFSLAQSEYYAYYMMWPKSADAEKAMFSRGFILNENLHNDSLALEVLEEFQKTYPNSEMNKDVNWLIENIRSGGKLAEELMKKIEAAE